MSSASASPSRRSPKRRASNRSPTSPRFAGPCSKPAARSASSRPRAEPDSGEDVVELHLLRGVEPNRLAGQVERIVPAGLDGLLQGVDALCVDVAGVALALAVSLEQHLERRAAMYLHQADRERCESGFDLAPAHEVRLDDDTRSGGDRVLEQRDHREVGPDAQPLRPREVAGADAVEERLLDRVLRDQRQAELFGDNPRDRCLAGRRRPGYDHQQRRVHETPYSERSLRSTNWRMPPWRKYSRSRGVSSRTRARNSLSSALTVTSSASPPSSPEIENSSRPVRPRDSAFSPGMNCSGAIPIISRFERWIRSYESAIAARTPSRFCPLAAQSREEPEPYSLPAITMVGTPSARYRSATSKIVPSSPSGRWAVHVPSLPGTRRFLSRTFAKVPRIITSWLPRRAP